MSNTRDMSEFGYIELAEAGDLLRAYADNPEILEDGVAVEFNPNSGNVFLVDDDCNVALLNRGKLERWYSCPICGWEGFLDEMDHGEDNEGCQEYLREIKKGSESA